MILIVTYDLKQPTGSYKALFEVLKGQNSWWHYIPSTWLVDADASTPKEFFQLLKPNIFEGDRILVTKFESGYSGWLPGKAWKWMKNRGLNP